MTTTYSTASEIRAAVAPLASAPHDAAAFFDLDGTLAPIVPRPEDSRVPKRTRELVRRIAERYAIAGVISGRQATEARKILGLDELTYIGNHGFELLAPGAERPESVPALEGKERLAVELVRGLGPQRIERAGLRVEDKGAIVALHWRGADDEQRARSAAAEIGAEAERAGLHTHRGRMVLELRPPIEIDKGVGLVALLSRSTAQLALYAGDDRTDADAFRALGALTAAGRLRGAVRVAVLAEETPAEVAAAADLAVDGPRGFVSVLEALL